MICQRVLGDTTGICKIDCAGQHIEVAAAKTLYLVGFEFHGATGGSVHVKPGGNLISINNKFVGNTGLNGGAIKLESSSNCQMFYNEFFNNEAVENGGALYSESSFASIAGCTFVENVAQNGGGVYAAAGSVRMSLDQSVFASNVATVNGAAVSLANDNVGYFEVGNSGCDNVDPTGCNGAHRGGGTCDDFGRTCESPTPFPTPGE